MTSTEYATKLRDPRWQKRRLEIFNLHNFTCQDCGAKDKTLHAHHCYYFPERDPWEYNDDAFRCLCEPCHGTRHDAEAEAVLEFRRRLAQKNQTELFAIFFTLMDANMNGYGLQIITVDKSEPTPADFEI